MINNGEQMIHFFEGANAKNFPLCQEMFRARASQFVMRLGWSLNVDNNGLEIDQFDDPDAHYVIVTDETGSHAGSARLRSTLKPTLVNDIFLHLLDSVPIRDASTWECSRFCLSDREHSNSVSELLRAIAVFGLRNNASSILGVYDKSMERIYRRYNISPITLCCPSSNPDGFGIGAWLLSDEYVPEISQGQEAWVSSAQSLIAA